VERANDKRLEEIRASGKPIYSISRLDAINRCLYESYITYILEERGSGNVYSNLGGRVHDVLEGITNHTKTESDLLPAMQAELADMDMLGIQFPKDRAGNDSIRQHWVQDMTHFCETYQAPKNKNLAAEELFIYETPAGNILQGYIDLQNKRSDGSIDIYDYKTSSLYVGDTLKEHSRQLITYALGKEQEGYRVNSASFIFLKYAEIQYIGKKNARSKEETLISKAIERYKIGSEMADKVEVDLIKAGFGEIDIEIILDKFKRSNRFEDLPEQIRDNYKMKPYVLQADISDEAKQECINYIDTTIAMWEALSKHEKDYPPRKFTKINKSGKESNDVFFCLSLCPHFKRCEYIHDFLDQQQLGGSKDEEDLF